MCDLDYWQKFYKKIKPCYKCGSTKTEVEYSDSIDTRPYVICYSCAESGPVSVGVNNPPTGVPRWADENAVALWNSEWEKKASKLLKYLVAAEDDNEDAS